MLALVVVFVAALWPARAGADTTDPTTLVGEGGSFLTPVTDVLLRADTGLSPLLPSYNDANLDNAIGDFVGTGPGSFDADFVVSERPLTTAEAATAKTDGRSFAYVPFAATPVAVATLDACNPSGLNGNSSAGVFCQGIPLTVPLVAALFTDGLTSPDVAPNTGLFPRLAGWNDPRLTQSNGQPIPDPSGIGQASSLLPSAETTALMSLIDSNAAAREELDNALNNPGSNATTTSDTPSEIWPFHGNHAFVGGDAGLIGKELTINAQTNAPSALPTWLGLGADNAGTHDVFAVSSVWTGAPQGTPWDIPTGAVQNAQGAFVVPTETAAAASEADGTLDPTTNLVTFNPNAADAAAYNNYLMVESYLVVPTSGLSADKATKLAQYIRFIVGPTARSDETTLGSAPPTAAMVAADLKVATELDAEAASSSSGSSGSSTTTTTTLKKSAAVTSANSAAVTSAAGAGSAAASGSAGAGDTSSGNGLAFTGTAHLGAWIGVGAALILAGSVLRRRLKRREMRS
jgi:hypothetical protein